MMTIIRFLSEPFWQQLGLTLLHFLWQGLIVAVLVAAVVRLFRLRHGHSRYRAYLPAFSLMAACPLLTFMAIDRPSESRPVPPNVPAAADPAVEAQRPGPGETSAHPRVPVPGRFGGDRRRLPAADGPAAGSYADRDAPGYG